MSTRPRGWELARQITALVLALVAVGVGVYVPHRIDHDAWQRQRQVACLDAVVDLRAPTSALAAGHPSDGAAGGRSAWDDGQLAIDRVRVTCPTHLDDALADRGRQLWLLYQTAREDAERGEQDPTNARQILEWTSDAIEHLTASR